MIFWSRYLLFRPGVCGVSDIGNPIPSVWVLGILIMKAQALQGPSEASVGAATALIA